MMYKNNGRRFFLFSLSVFVIGIIVLGIFMIYKITQTTQKVFTSGDNAQKSSLTGTLSDIIIKPDESSVNGYHSGRINILLLGIAGEDTEKKGAFLTDTIMIASIDVTNHRVALMSLPRDLLVEIGSGLNKINAFYGIGVKEDEGAQQITEAVESVTGLEMHYHLVMDFFGFTQVVDALGGINVTVPRTIDDKLYPGPGYSYESFYIEKGLHTMSGETALKYVRTRHDDPLSDFGRAKRQQSVLRAIRNKSLSVGTLANPFTILELLEILSDHIATNISTREVRALSSLFEKVDTQNVTTVVVDAWKEGSLLRSIKRRTPVGTVAGLTPRTGDWDEISEYADAIFNLEKITLRRDAIIAEAPHLTLINASGEKIITSRVAALLRGLGFADISQLPAKTDTTAEKTLIIDHTDAATPFSLDELTTKLGGDAQTQIPSELSWLKEKLDQATIKDDNTEESKDDEEKEEEKHEEETAEFTIILGEDLIETHGYEHAERETVEKEYKPLPPK